MTFIRPTPEERAAREVERKAKDLAQHIAVHEALGNLIAMKRLNLKPMNQNLLWAEFDYAKAMHVLYSDDCTKEMLSDAAAAFGVDEDGNDVESGAESHADYADHMNDRIREDRMVAQWESAQ